MGRDHHDDKKRALVMGKFKLLYQDDAEDLEAGDKFNLAVTHSKLLGPITYKDRDGKKSEILRMFGQERQEVGRGFTNPDIRVPGALKQFTVVWSNPFGDIFVDSDIKLYEIEDVQKYSSYNDGPKSKDFCRFYTSSSSKELDGFDGSIFWSAGFLWKHFGTCGVEAWDLELAALVAHYRNWKEWSHTVHTREHTVHRRQGQVIRQSGTSLSSSSCPPIKYAAPLPPLQSPCQPWVHMPAPVHPLHTPPAPGSRFKYINPHHAPPPLSSWITQVDTFLSEEQGKSSSTLKHTRLEEKKRVVSDNQEQEAKRFCPKASVLPPSPGSNERAFTKDSRPNGIYVGEIVDWRGKFGFMVSSNLEGKVFVHSKDCVEGRELVKVGARTQFEVEHQESSKVGAKAVRVKILR